MTGRPSLYTPELETRICEEIAEGKSLREICRADDMPSRDTVYAWKVANQAFSDRYARAVEDRAEKLEKEILAIADDDEGDYGFKEDKDGDGEGGKPFILPDNIQRAKLRVDARKWIASKLFPKKYGDKVQAEHTGAEGGPIAFAVTVNYVKPPHGTDG
jgi:hypothetical protein